MSAETKLTLVIHGAAGAIDHLALLPGGAPDLVVELSPRPALAFRLQLATPPDYPGLAGLASAQVTLEELVVQAPVLTAPLILAPGASCAPGALSEGLARLREADASGRRIAVLWSVEDDSWNPAEVLAECDRVVFLWDPERPATDAVLKRVERLRAEEALTAETWGGWIFHPAAADRLSATDEVALRRAVSAFPRVASFI